MTIQKCVRVDCDIPWCKTSAVFDHQYGPAARKELAESGWQSDAHSRKDFCPEHADLGSPSDRTLRLVAES